MEKTIMCPVCGKEGIPDFRKEDVVCPCCGSDLSVYRKLDGLITISDKVCKPRGKSTMYWGLVVLLVVLQNYLISLLSPPEQEGAGRGLRSPQLAF